MASNLRFDPLGGLPPVLPDEVERNPADPPGTHMDAAARPQAMRRDEHPPRQYAPQDLMKPVMIGSLVLALAVAVFL